MVGSKNHISQACKTRFNKQSGYLFEHGCEGFLLHISFPFSVTQLGGICSQLTSQKKPKNLKLL